MASAWHWVSIGTRDLEAALDFWVARLGFECVARAEGDDLGLRQHWGLPDQHVARQAMVRSPAAAHGGMHIVEWAAPAESVRGNAQVFDLCPKNLDIYVDDLPARMAQLVDQGVVFRNEQYSEAVSPDGVHFRETHLAGHDDINIVLLQVIGSDTSIPPTGFLALARLSVSCGSPRRKNVFMSRWSGSSSPTTTFLRDPTSSR
jgi:catechol 2,3-dioxygenase-like lactoylglutathione lyase family enzyme